jgi:hypothetical protein
VSEVELQRENATLRAENERLERDNVALQSAVYWARRFLLECGYDEDRLKTEIKKALGV